MGRKVGSFTNPDTGSTNYLDIANVPKLPVIPDQITRFKDTRETLITYQLSAIDKEHVIVLTAEYEYNGNKIKAEQKMDEETFARQLAENVYADNTIDGAPIVVAAKRNAIQEIGEKLLDSGAIMGNAVLSGIGFIRSKGMRVISIEEMFVTVYQNGTADVKLRNCVGNAALKNLIEPSIVFYTGRHKLEIKNYSVKEDCNDLVRTYTVTVADINILPKDEEVSYQAVELNKDDEESLEQFLIARRCLLDDGLSTEDALDERFADIF